MKRFFRLLLLALVLILVALLSAFTAMRFAIHGREVKIPKLIGMPLPQAQAMLGDAGLLLDPEDRFYSSTIAGGSIVAQWPAAGTTVRRGWHVRVGVSLGAPRADVPDVLGQSARAGEINVKRRGVEVGAIAIAHLPGLPADQVVAESPPPESGALQSPNIDLLVTAPQDEQNFVMPDFTGWRLAEAARVIQAAGFKVTQPGAPPQKSAEAAPPEFSQAPVLRQSPAAGQKVSPGTTIVLETSTTVAANN
jgi:beta-lactam-binding protein with PASTA domain